MMISIQGQLIYWRDYKNLNLLWQDVTQLFSRNSGQWLTFGMMMAHISLEWACTRLGRYW